MSKHYTAHLETGYLNIQGGPVHHHQPSKRGGVIELPPNAKVLSDGTIVDADTGEVVHTSALESQDARV